MKKLIFLFLTAAALVGCKKEKTEAPKEQKEIVKDVKLQELKFQNVKNMKMYNGDIVALQEVGIITPTGGYVKEINFKNGDVVKKGDKILSLTDATTEASYLETEGNLIKAKSNYETRRISYEKYKDLYDKKLISEEIYLDSKNMAEQSLGDLKIAKAGYLRASDNYNRLSVVASIDGVVTDLEVKKDEKVNSTSKLMTVVENNMMEIKIAVSGEDVKHIEIGKEAEVFVSDLNKNYLGKVSELNLSADERTKKYEVEIQIPNENKEILKGMYGKVELEQGEVRGLFVPKEAVMIKDLYSYIAILRDDVVSIYKVDRGIAQGDLQEIIFEEYKEGDKIVVQGQYLLNNNDKVKEI